MDWFLYDKDLRRERVKLNEDREKSFLGAKMFGYLFCSSSFKIALGWTLSRKIALREKYPNTEFFKIRIQEYTDQKKSVFGHFSRSVDVRFLLI